MKKILVTGAGGKIASLLIPKLAAHQDLIVRAFGRDLNKLTFAQSKNIEFMQGTFENVEQVRASVKDIDTIVLITSANPKADEQAHNMLTVALEEGVSKIVRISVFKSAIDGPTDITRLHGITDMKIQNLGLAYVILRPAFFMQNLLFLSKESLLKEDKVYFGTGSGKFGMIDLRDIVDCALQCTITEFFNNRIFTLTGPQSISFQNIAERLTILLKREIKYVPVTPEIVQRSIENKGMGEWYAKVMKDLCAAYSTNWGDSITKDVEQIKGQTPRSFDTFAEEVLIPALNLEKSALK
jgi:uncharacterized protein YbjT (DUF2867 family)